MNKKIKPFLYLPFFALVSCASKEDLNVVEYDVRKLKTESETIKSQTAGSFADVQQVRDDILRLQGRIEEVSHKSTEIAQSNDKAFRRLSAEDSLLVSQYDDIVTRLEKIEQYLGLGKEASPSAATASAQNGGSAPIAVTDAELLREGQEKLDKKRYNEARESFSKLMQAFSKSDLVDDAQFFVAESYFAEKWYEKAILEYQVVISKYTKSNRRATALYKQALSFEAIGDSVNARARYKDLAYVYPTSPEAGLAKKKLR